MEPTNNQPNQPKLNWIEKVKIKTLIKKYKQKLKKVKKRTNQDRAEKIKPELIKNITELFQDFEYEDTETGQLLTIQDLKKKNIEELTEILEASIQMLEQIV